MDKKFKILVFIKQVPDTDDIKWTENNTIQREGLDSIINPYDLSAIQTAVEIKKYRVKNAEIIAASMGPAQAEEALKQAIALGADRAFLLCDRKFSGSDTLATAYTLSRFVKEKEPDFNLIICGQQAIDGDTAQTPASMAEKLNIPQITGCKSIEELTDNSITAISETKTSISKIKSELPALLTIDAKGTYIQPHINDYMRSQDTKIITLTSGDINADKERTGYAGSPTYVKKAYRAMKQRKNTIIEENYIEAIKNEITSAGGGQT